MLFLPPGMQKEGQASADAAHARYLRARYPVLYASLVEAKTCAVGGWLPGPGGLDEQTGGLKETLEWLAEVGMLEWVHRSSPSGL